MRRPRGQQVNLNNGQRARSSCSSGEFEEAQQEQHWHRVMSSPFGARLSEPAGELATGGPVPN